MDFTPGVYSWQRASILGEGGGRVTGGQSPPYENIGGGKHIVLPSPPIISTTWQIHYNVCNARIGFKSTGRHYKTIKCNIKILLNRHNFPYCGAFCAQSLILRLCEKYAIFLTLAPPPPHPKKWIDAPDSWRTPGVLQAYIWFGVPPMCGLTIDTWKIWGGGGGGSLRQPSTRLVRYGHTHTKCFSN